MTTMFSPHSSLSVQRRRDLWVSSLPKFIAVQLHHCFLVSKLSLGRCLIYRRAPLRRQYGSAGKLTVELRRIGRQDVISIPIAGQHTSSSLRLATPLNSSQIVHQLLHAAYCSVLASEQVRNLPGHRCSVCCVRSFGKSPAEREFSQLVV